MENMENDEEEMDIRYKEMDTLYKKYGDNVKIHLSQYKEQVLNINQCGTFKKDGKPHSHILPDSFFEKNILPSDYHDEIINYLSKNNIKLDENISHLNSSQALCFNLFLPILIENKCDVITADIIPDNVKFAFEHIEDEKEYTNFDLFIEQNNQKYFFEIKYTESCFGSGDITNQNLQKKYKDVYLDTIKKFKYLERDEKRFFKHYQFFRNMFYCLKGRVYFVFPKARYDLDFTINWLEKKYCPEEYVDNIKIITIDDILGNINTKIRDEKLLKHYKLFKEKYIIEDTWSKTNNR